MKVVVTTGQRLSERGRRLDASYHASEGVQALGFIRRWAGQKPVQVGLMRERPLQYGHHSRVDLLADVCDPNGIFIGGRSKRNYVNDPARGIPFLSSSDMLMASFESAKLISNKQPDLGSMILRQGWTLISRSGTIGNTAYVRDDMDGLAGSEHIMRVVPDPNKIPTGYVYAFLSSQLGKTLLQSGTFGSVIDTISTDFVGSIPIPRLEPITEQRIHELIEQAASLRVVVQRELYSLVEQLNEELLGIPKNYTTRLPNEWSYSVNVVRRGGNLRLDPFHYVGHAAEYQQYLKPGPQLREIAKVMLPGQFKRMYVGPHGVPYLSGVDVYQLKVVPRLWLSPRQPELPELVISEEGTILVQADGQRYGLLGRPVYVDEAILGSAFSNHLVRIYCHELEMAGYIYLFFSTEAGRRELIRHSYGTSIPTIPVKAFGELHISCAETELAREMGQRAITALRKRTQANTLEDQAQALLAEALGLKVDSLAPARRGLVEAEV